MEGLVHTFSSSVRTQKSWTMQGAKGEADLGNKAGFPSHPTVKYRASYCWHASVRTPSWVPDLMCHLTLRNHDPKDHSCNDPSPGTFREEGACPDIGYRVRFTPYTLHTAPHTVQFQCNGLSLSSDCSEGFPLASQTRTRIFKGKSMATPTGLCPSQAITTQTRGPWPPTNLICSITTQIETMAFSQPHMYKLQNIFSVRFSSNLGMQQHTNNMCLVITTACANQAIGHANDLTVLSNCVLSYLKV